MVALKRLNVLLKLVGKTIHFDRFVCIFCTIEIAKMVDSVDYIEIYVT